MRIADTIQHDTSIPTAHDAEIAVRDAQRLFHRHLASWATDVMAWNQRIARTSRSATTTVGTFRQAA
ncbi:MAG: hypothetical protein AAF432_05015 [Planctomycetota bacterium]